VNLRDYHVAVKHAKTAAELAKKAIELAPKKGGYCNTLGAAQYRAGDWNAAIDALEKSMQLRSGGDSTDWLFLAMAHWQLAHKDEARQWYDKAVEWMDKNKPDHEELRRFRAERVAGYCGSSHSTGSSFSRSYRDALRPGYVSVTRQARCGHRAIVADESGSATAPAKQDSTRRPPGV